MDGTVHNIANPMSERYGARGLDGFKAAARLATPEGRPKTLRDAAQAVVDGTIEALHPAELLAELAVFVEQLGHMRHVIQHATHVAHDGTGGTRAVPHVAAIKAALADCGEELHLTSATHQGCVAKFTPPISFSSLCSRRQFDGVIQPFGVISARGCGGRSPTTATR